MKLSEVDKSIKAAMKTGLSGWHPDADDSLLSGLASLTVEGSASSLVAQARDLIKRAILEEMSGPEQRRLLILFAIGDDKIRSWYDRKRDVAREYPECDGDFERYRKEPMTRDLRTLLKILGSPHSDLDAGIVAPQGFYVKEFSSYYDLAKGKNVQTRTLIPVGEPLVEWAGPHFTHKLPKQDILLIDGDAKLVRDREGRLGGRHSDAFMLSVRFNDPIPVGQPRTFTLLREHKPTDDEWLAGPDDPSERHVKPQQSIAHASYEVRFPEDRRPRKVWAFTNLADWLQPGDPALGEELKLTDNVARHEWLSPAVGFASGIAWYW